MAPIIGYWGVPTSTIDWCEENYVTTIYIAEFWNTISNLIMIIPSINGLLLTYRYNLYKRFLFCFLSLLLVGIGSWNFHMTLLYEMQLFDEIPMIWGSLLLVYCLLNNYYYPLFEYNNYKKKLLILSLIIFGLFTLLIYLLLKIPILFQLSYVIIATSLLYLTILSLKYLPCNKNLFISATFLYHFGVILK